MGSRSHPRKLGAGGREKSPRATTSPARNDNSGGANDERTLEKRILRKVDLHLLVPLWFLFLVGFMDRINLGNVVVLGMAKDLNLKNNQYNIALQAFFITYIPSRPSYLISALSFFWGISSLCQGLVKNFGSLLVCRLLIGVFEAGFTPAAVYLMSAYYKRHEFQFRFNIFWTAGVIVGSVAGLLAYAVNNMDGVGGLAGWRWILIIEGLLACALAGIASFTLADWPHQARFLSPADKAFWIQRSQFDARGEAQMERLDKRAVLRTLKDWKIWCGGLMYLSVGASGYASSLFTPSILKSLGYTGVESQVQSIPIWAVAAAVTFGVGLLSDKVKHRYGFIMFGLTLAILGYSILIGQGAQPVPGHLNNGLPLKVRYMAVFFATTGTHMAQPVVIVWLANNLGGSYKRGIGSAIQILFGSFSGIISSNVFMAKYAPRYFVGYGVVLGLLALCGVVSTLFALGLVRENRMRDQGLRDHRLQLGEEERENLGDDHPSFRFTL
ncbi:transmembrane transporter [Myriangium duriaei CBS 260.36]|uniref:Transmembrane transporter n=1 Tax=Myriangium duriaei CBS 260.36 TaxID=1168546 RepID=A0A9P4MFT0_9PEZI|nr:transmembrane transporter [Myriangium duriaei CBS 260.36]